MHVCTQKTKSLQDAVLSQIVHALIKKSSSGKKITVRYVRGGTHMISNEINSQMRSPTHVFLCTCSRKMSQMQLRWGQAFVALQMNSFVLWVRWCSYTLENLRIRANVSSCALLIALFKGRFPFASVSWQITVGQAPRHTWTRTASPSWLIPLRQKLKYFPSPWHRFRYRKTSLPLISLIFKSK